MILNKWRLEALVGREPGLTVHQFAERLGVGYRTALRHADRHKRIHVERGKGTVSRLWLTYDLPDHLEIIPTEVVLETSLRSPRIYTLDEDFESDD